jgi:hypothetical protein
VHNLKYFAFRDLCTVSYRACLPAGNDNNNAGWEAAIVALNIVEPAVVPEFFVCGVGRIENMGTVSRHVLVTERRVGDRVLFVPKVHIIMSNADCQLAILKTARELAINLVSGGDRLIQH